MGEELRQADAIELFAMQREIFGASAYDLATVVQLAELFPSLMIIAKSPAGDAVGFAMGAVGDDGTGWVLLMGVVESARRSGLGSALMNALLYRIDERAARTKLTVDPESDAAIQLYHRMGFRTTDRIENYLGPGRDRLVLVRETLPGTPERVNDRN